MDDILDEVIKQTLYIAVGLVLKTGEQLQELSRQFTESIRMSYEEGRQFVEQVEKEKSRSDNRLFLEEKIHEVIRKIDLAGRDELNRLQAQVIKLETVLREKKIITD